MEGKTREAAADALNQQAVSFRLDRDQMTQGYVCIVDPGSANGLENSWVVSRPAWLPARPQKSVRDFCEPGEFTRLRFCRTPCLVIDYRPAMDSVNEPDGTIA